MRELITDLENVVRDRLADWPSGWEGYHWPGYTYEHTLRVRALALRLARDIVRAEKGTLTALRILGESEDADMEVEMEVLRQMVEDVLGEEAQNVTFSLKRGASVVEGILAEAQQRACDLIVIGASEEWFLRTLLFGSIPDRLADRAPCSVLMVRKAELAPVSWLRRMVRKMAGFRHAPAARTE